nr:immunoglobulin heavy chain junction region [Macaca mulatta]MOV47657.1 immunoglobulin heavy chain junction region [Macaca mulatta]MOV47731.1 immunoglobulin heavy chain junction region [Macaca mulatta]MOV47806.1 immunoglobulin heavy chain junction region [Macaca mulatta]MOV48001.1 immunoglobulin heavy chain junction region [Macaca mulatta]
CARESGRSRMITVTFTAESLDVW